MKSRITDFIDSILLFASLSILGFIVVGYFSRQTVVILISGFTFGLGCTFLINLFKDKKSLPAKKRKQLENSMNRFIYSGSDFCLNYFKTALSKKYDIIVRNDFLIINRTAIFVYFKPQKLNLTAFSEFYGNAAEQASRILILTAYGADAQVLTTAAALEPIKTDIFSYEKVYELLKWLNAVPQDLPIIKKKKSTAKIFIMETFNKRKAKNYLFIALILLFSSMFMPFGIYYIVMGSVLICVSVLCQINIIERLNKTKKSK